MLSWIDGKLGAPMGQLSAWLVTLAKCTEPSLCLAQILHPDTGGNQLDI
jgi:hypothetical protein